MKKLISVILLLLLTLSLCACKELDFTAKIQGTWTMDYLEDTEFRDELLAANDLYDEEIALVEASLHGIKQVTFNSDKTYTFSEPVDETKALVRDFYDQVFDDLYQGRDALKGLYEQDISAMDEADFKQLRGDLRR